MDKHPIWSSGEGLSGSLTIRNTIWPETVRGCGAEQVVQICRPGPEILRSPCYLTRWQQLATKWHPTLVQDQLLSLMHFISTTPQKYYPTRKHKQTCQDYINISQTTERIWFLWFSHSIFAQDKHKIRCRKHAQLYSNILQDFRREMCLERVPS